MTGFRWLFDRIDPMNIRLFLQLKTLLHSITHTQVRRQYLISLCVLLVACKSNQTLTKDLRPKLHRVYFHGVTHLKESDIRKKIIAENVSSNPFLRKENYLDHPFSLDLDKERIVAYYRDCGYHQAKVKTELKRYPADPKQQNSDVILTQGSVVDVHFYVEEGLPITIAQLQFLGMETLSEQERLRITERVKIKPGQILNLIEYRKERIQMLEWLQRQGYAFAVVDIDKKVQIDEEKKTATVQFLLVPGKKAVFGTIAVEGCERTEPRLVATYAALVKGDPYHPDEIQAAERKLYSLGLFSNIEFKLDFVEGYERVANVRIFVKEEKPQDIPFGLGLGLESSRTEGRARFVYTHRNFLGGLRNFRLSGNLGWAALPAFWSPEIKRHGPIFDVDSQLIQPDVFGFNSDLRLNFGYHVGIEYAYQFHGPTLAIGAQKSFWHRRIQLGLSYHFQYLKFFNTDSAFLPDDPATAGALFGYTDPYRLGYFQQDFALDLRNRTIDPTRGFYFGLRAEEGGIYSGSLFDYQKIQPEIRAYYSFGSKVRITLAGRAMFGHIFSQGDFGSPITQRFYLGGPNSHRGFNYNRLSYQVCSELDPTKAGANITCPVDPMDPQYQNPNLQRLPVGGDQMFLAQFELRARLVQLFGNWFSLAAFVDGGDVATPSIPKNKEASYNFLYNSNVDLTRMHWAVGGGIRYQTILGTLRFDLGVRLNRLDFAESSGQILNPDPGNRITYHISIGEAF